MSLWPCESLPAIFANGSSLRDLWSRDTGQLEKGKHRSLELSKRFMVYRGAILEIESLIRKCWWSDPAEDSVASSMSGSLRCHLTGHPITLFGPMVLCCDKSSLFVHCCDFAISIDSCNKWVTMTNSIENCSGACPVCLGLLPPPPLPPTRLHSGNKTGNSCSHVPRLQEPTRM